MTGNPSCASLRQKPLREMTTFWDGTADWRDRYYDRLLTLPPSRLSRVERAERDYCRIEARTVERLVHESDDIADLGCGTGRVTADLVERYAAKSFVGVDVSLRELAVYSRRLSQPARNRVQLVCSPVSQLALPADSCDLALFCNHTFGAILGNERAASLNAIRRFLRRDGQLLIVGFSNLAFAPACYANWGMTVVGMDRATGLIELSHHFSLWEPADALVNELRSCGLYLHTQTEFELGYLQIYGASPQAGAV